MTEQTTTAATGPAPVAAAKPAAPASHSAQAAANTPAGPEIIPAGDYPNIEGGADGRNRIVMTETFHARLTAAITANPSVGEPIRQSLKRDYPDYWGADAARRRAADFAGPGQ